MPHSAIWDSLTPQQKLVAEQRARDIRADAVAKREAAELKLQLIIGESKRRSCETLKGFTQNFWKVVEPDTPLVWNWHLDVLCERLEAAYRGDEDAMRQIFNVPPGTSKSLIASVMFRAWVWSKNPAKRFLCGSYGSVLSIRDNVKLRQVVQSEEYKQLFPDVVLTSDLKEKFETTRGGWSIATSVGGPGTGEHPDFVIIDDPTSAQQARSDADRTTANDWMDRTLSTRGVTRDVRVIVIMQRLHVFDLTGHLLAKGGWKHICFPMEFTPYREARGGDPGWTPDPRDQRTVAGELLWPALFTRPKVEQLKIDLGPYGAAGQLQQTPTPEGGGLFDRTKVEIIESLPPNVTHFCRGWDTAATSLGGDYTVGAKLGHDLKADIIYVCDIVRGQWDPDDVDSIMKLTSEADGKRCMQREQREPAAAGKSVINARRKLLKGKNYDEVPSGGDKVTNSKPFRSYWNGQRVKLLKGDWNEKFLSELSFFPVGGNDDQVDAASTAYNCLIAEPPRSTGAVW